MGDELHLPWKIGVNALKLEILNLMTSRYNLSFGEAIYRQITALVAYDPLVDEIVKTLIKECPYNGLPVLFGRNP